MEKISGSFSIGYWYRIKERAAVFYTAVVFGVGEKGVVGAVERSCEPATLRPQPANFDINS